MIEHIDINFLLALFLKIIFFNTIKLIYGCAFKLKVQKFKNIFIIIIILKVVNLFDRKN